MSKLRYLTKEGFRNLRVNKLMSVASITVLFSCLLMVGIAFMILLNIESFIESIEDENVILVYANLDIEAQDYDYMKLGVELKSISNVANVEKVEKDAAYAMLLSEMDEDLKNYLEGLDENPLPNGYRVTVTDMAGFEQVVSEIKKLDNVLRVHENSALARQLANLRNTVTYISGGVILLLLIVSLFIISNTIKVTMFSRRLEISIMKSVGATNAFIRWPFVVEGILIGILAGGLATAALWGVYHLVQSTLATTFDAFGATVTVEFRDYALYVLAAFVAIGVFTGVFGSLTSIRKYLKERKIVELDD
ncbi:MAG: permease-like cell division protein FtsX [Clostridia bacterium]|nr:permease-like cell division protein FtsX [Clostridia bacterium]